VQGVPVNTGDGLDGTVLKFGTALGVKVNLDDIDQVFRPRPSHNSEGPTKIPPIVVRFTRQHIRDEFINKRRTLRDLNIPDRLNIGEQPQYWLPDRQLGDPGSSPGQVR
jgi:hypothetical protein